MTRNAIGLLAFLAFFATSLCAQTGTDLFVKAEKSAEGNQLKQAILQCKQAIQAFEQEKNLSSWIKAQRFLAEKTLSDSQNPYNALILTDQALSSPFLHPLTEEEYFLFCKFLTFRSWLAKEIGDFVRVKKDLEEAHRIFKEKLDGKYPIIANYLYPELGNAYVRLAEYEGARQIFEENLQYSARYPQVAKFNDFGNLYLNTGNFPRAIEIFQKGLQFNQLLPDTSRLPDAEVKLLYLNIAESLAQMRRFKEALLENKKAEKAPLSVEDSRYERCRFGLYENYGIIYGGMARAGAHQKFPWAIEWYKKALFNAKDTPNREKAGFILAISDLYLAWGKPREALVNYQNALHLFFPSLAENPEGNPASNLLFAEKKVIQALQGKALALVALHQPEKALQCYELIPFVEAKLRATHAYESSSLLALKESRQRFQEGVDLAWQLYVESKGNPEYAERAFRLTELARGMLLLQSLVQASQFLPPDIRNREYELRVRMAWLEHELAELAEENDPANQPKMDAFGSQLFGLKQEKEALFADFPSYNNPDSIFLEVLAATAVHSILRPGQVMIDYFLTETAAYQFSFDALKVFRWRKIPLPGQFREQTKSFVSYLMAGEEPGREQFLHQAWILDSLLLADERKFWGTKMKSLVIVPDDVLMLAPFEVLLSKPAANNIWRDQFWLLEDYNIAYAYSATLLNVQRKISEEHERSTLKPAANLGGFAPIYSKSGSYALQNTGPMVKKVCSMLGGDPWIGLESSEERFKNDARNYRCLLLAMHGISDNEHPERSRLLFGDPGADSLINNNILYASELQIMRLQADLVVLSACHSGSGKLEIGEGLFSLARSFAAARVPATVMSLWLLHESTAPPLLVSFFAYLKQGKTKDEALRLAKLEFLKKDENFEMTHPFYWAGLAALGDMRPLDLPEMSTWKWYWNGFIVFVILVAIWVWWRRRQSHTHGRF